MQHEIECGDVCVMVQIINVYHSILDGQRNDLLKQKLAFNREHGKPSFYGYAEFSVKDTLYYKDVVLYYQPNYFRNIFLIK